MEVTKKQLAALFQGIDVKDRVVLLNIRSANKVADKFDDETCLYYNGDILYRAASTCDPGLSTLVKPVNPVGTAIVMNGFHRGLWKLGYHKGKYKAFVQNRPVVVFRDNDKDNILDINDITVNDPAIAAIRFNGTPTEVTIGDAKYLVERGMFGINCHRAAENGVVQNVANFSAGCCVVQDPAKYALLYRYVTDKLSITKGTEIDAMYVSETFLNTLK